jgi:hypothetical protein
LAQYGFIHLHNFSTDGIYSKASAIILSLLRSREFKLSVKLANSVLVSEMEKRHRSLAMFILTTTLSIATKVKKLLLYGEVGDLLST